MASTVLEQLRAGQEAIESYERAIVSILNEKPRNHRERVVHGHKVSNLLDKVVEQSQHVRDLYEDKDKTFEEETESMRGRAVFTSFYEQLKSIRAFHLKYPHTPVVHEPSLDDALNPQLQFSGEERFGKYVDLHELYARYLNLPAFQRSMDKYASRRGSNSRRAHRRENSSAESHASRVDYLTYLSCFHEFAEIPESDKLQSLDYQTYLVDLKTYLLDFYRKTQPLVDLDDVIAETRARFDKQWALHEIKGWDQQEPATENGGSQPPPLFCTVCDKQFTSEGVYTSHFSGKKHKKAAAAIAANSSASSSNGNGSAATNGTSKKNTIRETIAFDEILIRRLHELLTEVIHGTISYLEVKQTRTHDELQAEIAEEEEGAFSDVDVDNALGDDNEDDDQPIYNPLNLPLGWDGKPIPYWLYKLHGLGMEFKCEICGNHSYWGRRDFDRHFQQWRHAHGMRCLGIPNTKHFHDITLISDAKALYEKLKDQIDAEVWNASNEEEFEDSEGNVLSRKTFEDLARQGLL